MKLATYQHPGRRDGVLMVVNRALSHCVSAQSIAPNLQYALDYWHDCSAKLIALYDRLNRLELPDAEIFDPLKCHSPLPRAYQWADGSAYVNHVELVRKARGAALPQSFWSDPLMYQGGSDAFVGPCDPIWALSQDWGIDFEAEVAVITDRLHMGANLQSCAGAIRLLMLVNDVSLRHLIPDELAKGFGFFQSKPASAFSPVAVTPDELGESWRDGKVHLPLQVFLNQTLFGRPNAGVDMIFNFPQLINHITKTREIGAGSIVGSGTVSNKQGSLHGSSIAGGGVGYCCIAEVRMWETIEQGKPITPFLQFGDRVRIEMFDPQGQSIFGAIDQMVARYPQ